MSKYARKVDKNQGEIVTALSDIGVSVFPMHGVGGGFPDLLWFYRSVYGLMEVKCEEGRDSAKYRDERCLTPAQKDFHASWPGPIDIVWTADEAREAVMRRVA